MAYKVERYNKFKSKFEPIENPEWEYIGEDPEQKDFDEPCHSAKVLGKNGDWLIVRYRGDAAIYSVCSHCAFPHTCYKVNFTNFDENNPLNENESLTEYDEEQEFNFCPECGERMLEGIDGAQQNKRREKVNG